MLDKQECTNRSWTLVQIIQRKQWQIPLRPNNHCCGLYHRHQLLQWQLLRLVLVGRWYLNRKKGVVMK